MPVSGARNIAVYDGQHLLGFVIVHEDKTCVAKDAAGRRLGTFPSVKAATDAIDEVDKAFSSQRQGGRRA